MAATMIIIVLVLILVGAGLLVGDDGLEPSVVLSSLLPLPSVSCAELSEVIARVLEGFAAADALLCAFTSAVGVASAPFIGDMKTCTLSLVVPHRGK